MPITHTIISRGKSILVRHGIALGNFEEFVASAIGKTVTNMKTSYQYDNLLINLTVNEFNVFYICITDLDYDRNLAFKYLEFIKTEFERKYGDLVKTALAYSMKEFEKNLKLYMDHFNKDGLKFHQIENDIDNIVTVMHQNINKALERSENLERVHNESEVLAANSVQYSRVAQNVHRYYSRKHWKLILGVVAFFVVIALILILVMVLDRKK